MKGIWLGLFLWGISMGLIPTPTLAKILIGLGVIGWLGVCVMVAGIILWKVEDYLIDRESDE